MSRHDWLVPMDDAMCDRLQCCSSCGTHGGRAWFDVAMVENQAVGVTVCERCQRTDPQQVRLSRLLQHRYNPARYNGKEA